MFSVEEILVKNEVFKEPQICNFNLIIHRDCYIIVQINIKKAMIEFAKLHVQKALEQASENAQMKINNEYLDYFDDPEGRVIIAKDTILESYSLINIK